MADIRDTILGHIQAHFVPERKVDATTRLITSGWVNSLEMASVKTFLEDQYQVRIPDALATREVFDSVDSIVALLARLGVR